MRIWSGLVVLAVCLAVVGNVSAQDKEKKDKKCPDEIFKKLDKDASGDLTVEEFVAHAKDDAGKQKATERFKKIDKDGNGKVTLDEFKAVPEKKHGGKEKKEKK
jgi:Ca2+-binding EF-hand superfamily protein